MEPSLLTVLDDIIQAAESFGDFREILQEQSADSRRVKTTTFHVNPFDFDAFREQLSARSLSGKVCEEIFVLLKNTICRFQRHSLETFNNLALRLPRDVDGSNKASLQNFMASYVSACFVKFANEILNEIDQAISRFHADAEAIAQSDDGLLTSSSSDEGGLPTRGLPPLATKLFEAIYARTDKITQAERDRLAEATGVPARSVTIWFQNRRNRPRKPSKANGEVQVGEAQAKTLRQSTDIATLQNDAKGKRKASLYDDGRGFRMPSEGPRQRRRLSSTEKMSSSPLRQLSSTSTISSMAESSRDSLYSWHMESIERARSISLDSSSSSAFDDDLVRDEEKKAGGQEQIERTTGTNLIDSPNLSEVEMPMLFDNQGNVQLGFADLQLDLADLSNQLGRTTDPARREDDAYQILHGRVMDLNYERRASQPQLDANHYLSPTTSQFMAELLGQASVNVPSELMRLRQAGEGPFDVSNMIGGIGDDWFVNIEVPSSSIAASSPSQSASERSPQTPSKNLFNFDLQSLQIPDIIKANLQTYEEFLQEVEDASTPTALDFKDLSERSRQHVQDGREMDLS